jgi:predicted flap endonuclease-1-like 5' DNA nuclease
MVRRVIRIMIIVWLVSAALHWARRNGIGLGRRLESMLGGQEGAPPVGHRRPAGAGHTHRRTDDDARAELVAAAAREARSARDAAPATSPADTTSASADTTDGEPAATPDGEAQPDRDDLKIIEGIGPRIDEVFHVAGVTTFAELAALPVERIEEILRDAGVRASPGTWPEQAMLAADGQWDALAEWQAHLKGGREVTAD